MTARGSRRDAKIDTTMVPLTQEISYLRGLGLSDVDLARATGMAEQNARVVTEQLVAEGAGADRIFELAAAVQRLERLIVRDHIAEWLRTSIPALGWATPLDLIGQGQYRQVGTVISGLEDPGAS